jgi:hypothetical protein
MIRKSFRHVTTAIFLLVAMLSQGTWALAGTTGGLGGSVTDADSSAPIAGAQVTATSPSQQATTSTDASGHFVFLALAPDTYTVSVTKANYQSASVPGQTVFADSTAVVAVHLVPALKTIAKTTSLGAGSLVRSGTTADVYSVNAANRDKISALGGGGSLNSAYAAVASVPGAYVPFNQTGYFQSVHIRGGDYDQVGYEFDGVPVNRSFDNYPSSGASSLGNSEVQVYTGATPANSSGEGLAGYINQVIKTGTYPGIANGDLGIGAPGFYHKASVEAGGATPDRLFSWYMGVGGYNQAFNYFDNSNGASYQSWLGVPIAPLSPAGGCAGAPLSVRQNYSSCYASGVGPGNILLGPPQLFALASLASRDVVMNFHMGIQHHNDGGRDDVQLLWDSSSLNNSYYSSTNDLGGTNFLTTGAGAALGVPFYFDGFQSSCAAGAVFTATTTPTQCVSTYLFPNSAQQRQATSFQNGVFTPIPNNERDSTWNNQQIIKAQYQKNFGSTAYLRVYGYTYYSDWLQHGPQSTYSDYAACCSPDYELSSHTRGIAAEYSQQFSDSNLLNVQASYVTASTLRDNNTQMINQVTSRANALVVVNAADPYSGFCYNGAGTSVTCNPGVGAAQFQTWQNLQNAGNGTAPLAALPTSCPNPNTTSTGCAYLLAENSQWATYNTVKPIFTAYSITDQWRPNDRWLLNLGLRLDSFQFNGSDTNQGEARSFWYAAYNQDMCVNSQTAVPIDKSALGLTPANACPTGYTAANLVNNSGVVNRYTELQPRIGLTYTFNPDTVVRASYGRYTEAPNAAYQQYNTLEADIPFALLGPNLYQYGRNQPSKQIYPPTSNNYDISLEQRLKGTAISFKFTPFYRSTQNQIQNFFLNQQTGFVSGLNVGQQTSRGFEFQVQDGNFAQDGLSGQFSFAYTYSTIKYGTLSNGTTIISPINAAIANYNAYTSACAPGGSAVGRVSQGIPVCGSTNGGVIAAPCYAGQTSPTPGQPVACTVAGAVANPYYNAPLQALINTGQSFPTYSIFPGGIGSSDSAFGAPYVATLVLNYKHQRWAITPSVQFQGGTRYGAPETTPGIVPNSCNALAGTTRYDATSCGATLVIPNQFTGSFDNLGSFVQPNEILGNLQLSYDVSPKITLVGTLANIFNSCWGGTSAPWTVSNGKVCSYGIVGAGSIPTVGNVYNPGSTIQQQFRYPYLATLGSYNDDGSSLITPFQFYLSARIKL